MIEILMNLIFHLDQYLYILIDTFGLWTYVILFGIVFSETGLVIFPFLPGDSLLFITGTFAGANLLNITWIFLTFTLAAILGDTVNYWIGYKLGRKAFNEKSRFFKKEYLVEAENFYKKHGNMTIIMARFIPIIRTFAPFVAGIGKMQYQRFIFYNIFGGIIWVSIFLFAGYFLGGVPIIRDNLSLLTIGIIIISFMPFMLKIFSNMPRNKKHTVYRKI
jgi:membrane-associated protein